MCANELEYNMFSLFWQVSVDPVIPLLIFKLLLKCNKIILLLALILKDKSCFDELWFPLCILIDYKVPCAELSFCFNSPVTL